MKKYLSLIPLLIVLCLLCSFSKNKEVTLTGKIISYGNTPLNYPVLKTDKNKCYAIKGTSELKKEIFTSAGDTIKVTGIIIKNDNDAANFNGAEDGYIEVIEWDYVE